MDSSLLESYLFLRKKVLRSWGFLTNNDLDLLSEDKPFTLFAHH